MEYVTRKELETFMKNKDKMTAEDFVYILEEKLDYAVSLEKKPQRIVT